MSLLSDLPEADRMADLIQEEQRLRSSRPRTQRFTLDVTDAKKAISSHAFIYRLDKIQPLTLESVQPMPDSLVPSSLFISSHIDVLVRRRSSENKHTRTHYVQIWFLAKNPYTRATRDEMMAYFEFTHLRGLDYEETVKEKIRKYVAAAITGERR